MNAIEIAGPALAVLTIAGAWAWDRHDKRHPQTEEVMWRLTKSFRAITLAIGETLLPTVRRVAAAFASLADALKEDE